MMTARVAWIGDGNNVCHSWMNAARQFGFKMVIAAPQGYEPDAQLLKACAAQVTLTQDPKEAVRGADIVVTDTWASMGQESEKTERLKAFAGYTVDPALMQLASKEAVFMHCLPAYRGVEVAAEVIDGPPRGLGWPRTACTIEGPAEFLLAPALPDSAGQPGRRQRADRSCTTNSIAIASNNMPMMRVRMRVPVTPRRWKIGCARRNTG
jgi:hypothetical protein